MFHKQLTMKNILILGIVCAYSGIYLHSQTDSMERSTMHLKLSANFCSNLNYYGRTDSLTSSGFFPLAEVWFNENFYVNAAPIFVNNRSSSFDYAGTVTTAGYQFFADEKKWFGNFYVIKPFYKSNALLVQSSLKAQAAFSISNLNKLIDITAGADVKVSDKIDFGVTAGLDHIFRKQFADNSVMVIDPSAYLFAGTQQFTKTNAKTGFLIPLGETDSRQRNGFAVLSYEFSMPLIFAKGKLQALFTPAYVMPQNLIVVEGRPDLSEKGNETFYATIGVKLIL
jgi:hypothetical protein